MQRKSAIVGGQRVEVEWTIAGDHLQAKIDDRVYDVEFRSEHNVCWLTWNGRSVETFAEETSAGLLVWLGDRSIAVDLLDTRKALTRAAHGGHEGAVAVHAPMPGRIVKVLQAEGSDVETNQGIVVMEAMKMQNEIKAPKSGKVQKLLVAAGDAVGPGDVIAIVG